jgi:hypothetical protein
MFYNIDVKIQPSGDFFFQNFYNLKKIIDKHGIHFCDIYIYYLLLKGVEKINKR